MLPERATVSISTSHYGWDILYHYQTKVKPLYKLIGPKMVKLVLFMMRDMGPAEEEAGA
jgi:hypothetical protein